MAIRSKFPRLCKPETQAPDLDAIARAVQDSVARHTTGGSMFAKIIGVAIVTGITSTAPVVVACFGVLLFKEKINRQQTLGIATTTMGLMLLVI